VKGRQAIPKSVTVPGPVNQCRYNKETHGLRPHGLRLTFELENLVGVCVFKGNSCLDFRNGFRFSVNSCTITAIRIETPRCRMESCRIGAQSEPRLLLLELFVRLTKNVHLIPQGFEVSTH
jgi:hypothetical protein